jgi:hypothetical protein
VTYRVDQDQLIQESPARPVGLSTPRAPASPTGRYPEYCTGQEGSCASAFATDERAATKVALIADALAAAGWGAEQGAGRADKWYIRGCLLGRVQPRCLEIEELRLINR